MFDDLRDQGNASPLFQPEEDFDPLLDAPVKKKGNSKSGSGLKLKVGRKFLGMTAFQRFVVSLALFVMVSVLGFALLFVSGAVVLF